METACACRELIDSELLETMRCSLDSLPRAFSLLLRLLSERVHSRDLQFLFSLFCFLHVSCRVPLCSFLHGHRSEILAVVDEEDEEDAEQTSNTRSEQPSEFVGDATDHLLDAKVEVERMDSP